MCFKQVKFERGYTVQQRCLKCFFSLDIVLTVTSFLLVVCLFPRERRFSRALAYFTWFSIPVENKGLLEVDLLRDDPKFWLTKCNIFCLSWYLVSYFVVTKDEEPAKTTHNDPKLFKNYSMSARWIWGGYEALRASLVITISYTTSANGIIVVLNFFKPQTSGYYNWILVNFILNITKRPDINVTSGKPRENHMTCAPFANTKEKNTDFRLTCVAQKRRGLNSLMKNRKGKAVVLKLFPLPRLWNLTPDRSTRLFFNFVFSVHWIVHAAAQRLSFINQFVVDVTTTMESRSL